MPWFVGWCAFPAEKGETARTGLVRPMRRQLRGRVPSTQRERRCQRQGESWCQRKDTEEV